MNVDEPDTELAELLATALEMRDEGRAIDPEALCSHRPELAASLREALGLATDFHQLHASAATHDRRLGTVLVGRYRLDERIGAGSMGVVYRSTDRELGRAVAVKVLHADCVAAGEAEARFLREAEVLAAVSHPAVVTVFDRGSTASGEHFVVMELLAGENVSHLVERAAAACGVLRPQRASTTRRSCATSSAPCRCWPAPGCAPRCSGSSNWRRASPPCTTPASATATSSRRTCSCAAMAGRCCSTSASPRAMRSARWRSATRSSARPHSWRPRCCCRGPRRRRRPTSTASAPRSIAC